MQINILHTEVSEHLESNERGIKDGQERLAMKKGALKKIQNLILSREKATF